MNLSSSLAVLTFLSLSVVLQAQESLQTLDQVRIGRDASRTRLVLDLSGAVRYEMARHGNPERLVIDVFDIETDLSSGPIQGALAPMSALALKKQGDSSLQLIVAVSSGTEAKIFGLKPHGNRGHRVVVDLFSTNIADSPGPEALKETQAKVASSAVDAGSSIGSSVAVAGVPKRQRDSQSLFFSGTWEQEWALETDDWDSRKFEALIEPRLDIRLSDSTTLTAIARIRLDAAGDLGPDESRPDNYSPINGPLFNDENAGLSLRELYVDVKWGQSQWRLGKQQVVWGEADGIKVLDVVNPQSFREFILDEFDDSRIPLTMVNFEMPVGKDAALQVLLIPDPTYHELAEFDTPFFITSPFLVPVSLEGIDASLSKPEVPDNLLEDGDVGARLTGFASGWDFTLNYLYHYQDYPVYYQQLNMYSDATQGVLTVTPEYERNHLVGGTVSNAFGDFTVRAELAYSTDTFHVSDNFTRRGIGSSADLSSVVGLDWHLGKYDTLLSFQWFQSHLMDYRNDIRRDQTEHNISLYYQRTFANETWLLDVLGLYSPNNSDSLIQFKLKHILRANLELWLGADIFSGDRDGAFGQFRDRDRLLFGLKLGF